MIGLTFVKYILFGCAFPMVIAIKKERAAVRLRESAVRSVITPDKFSPSAQRGKRYSLITDEKWFVSAVIRPG